MIAKTELKQEAIKLRKKGKTYSEILEEVPVAKSTLSLWLKEVNLSKSQKQRITKKRIEASRRGAKKRKEQRIEITKVIYEKSEKEIGKLSKRELWLIGIALYWAEGTKERDYRPGPCIDFINSDPYIILIFLKWLTDVCDIDKERIILRLFIHENNKYRLNNVIDYWLLLTGFSKIDYVYFKKHSVKTTRKKVTNSVYYGGLNVRVRKSSELVRKIAGWSKGMGKNYCRIV